MVDEARSGSPQLVEHKGDICKGLDGKIDGGNPFPRCPLQDSEISESGQEPSGDLQRDCGGPFPLPARQDVFDPSRGIVNAHTKVYAPTALGDELLNEVVEQGVGTGRDPTVDRPQNIQADVTVFEGPDESPCLGRISLDESMGEGPPEYIRSPRPRLFPQKVRFQTMGDLLLPSAFLLPVPDQQTHILEKSPAFLNAGIGYGGSCFPKDVAALYKTSTDHDYDFKLLRGVMEVNIAQREHFMNKVLRHFGKNLSGRTFAILGLAFKGNTDDIRDSVAIEIVKRLRGLGATLKVYDPQAMYNAKQVLGSVSIEYCLDKYEAMQGADALFILTEWKEFGLLELEKVKSLLKSPVIFDGRNLLDREKVEGMGFTYFAVGKRTNGIVKIDTRNLYQTVLLNTNGPTGHQ